MEYFGHLSNGITEVFSWPNILYPIAGTIIAMVVSFLPGVGMPALAAVLLVFTINWEPLQVLMLFGALTGGATFMGSVTAILFNIPGGAPSAAALLDGYPMGRAGRAKTAIACAATASAIGSVIGVFVLIAILPLVRELLLEFGPLERVLLGLWGLTAIAGFPNVSKSKALAATFLGLALAMVGGDPVTGLPHWSMGSPGLYQGIGTIALFIGIFTFAELLANANYRAEVDDGSRARISKDDRVWYGILAVFRHKMLVLKSALIGTGIGIVPGIGGTVAGLIAYGQAVRTAKTDQENFGKGDVRGLIAPEAAIDAKDGGSLLPALAFGLPGSEAGVVLVAVLTIHGLVPGQPMLTEQLSLTFVLIIALLLSNILTSVLGVAAAPYLARLTNFRIDRIALPAMLIGILALIQLNGDVWDVYMAVLFGIVGFAFKRLNWPRVPFVIAFVLGSFIQTNFEISARLLDIGRLSPLDRPLGLFFALILIVSLIRIVYAGRSKSKAPPYSAPDIFVATALVFLFGAMSVAAFMGGYAYSNYAKAIAVLAFLAALFSMILALRTIWNPHSASQAPSRQFLDLANQKHIMVFASLVVIVPAVGLPVGIGIFSVLWATQVRRTPYPKAIIYGALIGLISWFYIIEVANITLSQPLILSSLGHFM